MGANGTENAALWGVNVIDGQWFERGKSVKMPWKSGLSWMARTCLLKITGLPESSIAVFALDDLLGEGYPVLGGDEGAIKLGFVALVQNHLEHRPGREPELDQMPAEDKRLWN